jgi:hypothetical protein
MRYYNCADGSSSSNANGKEQMGLNVREDTRKGVYVENLIEEGVTGADAAGSILQRGYRNRYVCMHANTMHYTCTLCSSTLYSLRMESLLLRTQHQF